MLNYHFDLPSHVFQFSSLFVLLLPSPLSLSSLLFLQPLSSPPCFIGMKMENKRWRSTQVCNIEFEPPSSQIYNDYQATTTSSIFLLIIFSLILISLWFLFIFISLPFPHGGIDLDSKRGVRVAGILAGCIEAVNLAPMMPMKRSVCSEHDVWR